MILDELTRKRREVIKLLERGLEYRLVRHSAAKAVQLVNEAYTIAKTDRGLSLWQKICAYRLAHLKLRTGESREELLEVKSLFEEADREKFLGPWPELYLIVVYHRLGRYPGSEAFDVEKKFVSVCQSFMVRDSREKEGEQGCSPPAQAEILNYLDLISCILNIPYPHVEGAATFGRPDDLFRELSRGSREWQILTNARSQWNYRYPLDIAEKELDLIRERNPDVYAFRMVAGAHFPVDRNDFHILFRKPGAAWTKTDEQQFFLMLAISLHYRYPATLREKIMSTLAMDEDGFRQARRRFARYFRETFGKELKVTSGQMPPLPLDLPLIGLIHSSVTG